MGCPVLGQSLLMQSNLVCSIKMRTSVTFLDSMMESSPLQRSESLHPRQSEGRHCCMTSGISLSFIVEPVWPFCPPCRFLCVARLALVDGRGLWLIEEISGEGFAAVCTVHVQSFFQLGNSCIFGIKGQLEIYEDGRKVFDGNELVFIGRTKAVNLTIELFESFLPRAF